ncbi:MULTISPECIES: hypothetical protein [Exiguobacterium]|uniref:hypothetical protein n=1 Tax=Exiguobacterium TaxID=33986 RepID=UPI001BEA20E0|nr:MULTISPECIES: hypothetical protein [Exiguobacterium]MCT4776388.1 hypothetical protein [Exiguobacterium aquaticum]MCT4789394.1 hypothetical protein [Exiguobacterium mexicanum]
MNIINRLNENELKALRHDIEPLFLNNKLPRPDYFGMMDDDSKSVSLFSKKNPLQFLNFLFGSGESNQLHPKKREKNLEQLEQHALDMYTKLAVSTVKNSSVYERLSSIVNEYMEEELGELVWGKLEEKSRKFIMTAEVLSDFIYMFDDQLDYASPTINYCKAVENELNEKFVGPFKKYYISQNKRLKKDDYASKLANIISRPNAKLTLGEHVYIIRKILDDSSKLEIELDYKSFLNIADVADFKELNNKIAFITRLYRNPAGHTGLIKQSQCIECRKLVVTKNGVLKQLITESTNYFFEI